MLAVDYELRQLCLRQRQRRAADLEFAVGFSERDERGREILVLLRFQFELLFEIYSVVERSFERHGVLSFELVLSRRGGCQRSIEGKTGKEVISP